MSSAMGLEYTDARDVTSPVDDEADFVIVGSGAAGATAARMLSEAGFSVIVIEEGSWVRTEDFIEPLGKSMNRLFRDAGALVAEGRAFMPIIQGRAVGGSTVINSAIVWRMPEDVFSGWVGHGIEKEITLEALNECYDQIESEISVRSTPPEVQGPSNLLMEASVKVLEMHGAPTRRYDNGCRGAARCLQGCPHGAKQSMALTYIPRALRAGARLYAQCRVEKLIRESERGRVSGVKGTFFDPDTGRRRGRLTARAKRGVLIAASAIQTPVLLRKAGLQRGGVGDHFQAHPGIPMFGVFDSPQRAWQGATQGFDADHYRVTERFKVETLNLPPEMMLTRLPGIGSDLSEWVDDFDNLAMWVTQNRMEAHGRVRPFLGAARIRYTPTPGDMIRVRKGLYVMGEMMFAAGARVVFPGVYGVPTKITRDELSLLEDAPLDPKAYTWLATHLFGTARMGKDPTQNVVGTDFQVFDAPGLYVLDSSVFPTNLGVNPQHTIMAMSMLASKRLADRFS